jgi:hypothetical protein
MRNPTAGSLSDSHHVLNGLRDDLKCEIEHRKEIAARLSANKTAKP